MPSVKGPVTGNVYNVKYGEFQEKTLFEFTSQVDLENKYGSWKKVWGDGTFLPDVGYDKNEINKSIFGDFKENGWAQKSITKAFFNRMGNGSSKDLVASNWGTDGVKDKNDPNYHWFSNDFIKCHVHLVKMFEKLLQELFEVSNDLNYKIRTFHSYCYRYIKGTDGSITHDIENNAVRWTRLSNHSLGTAIDINAKQNWWKESLWDIPPEIVKLFRKYGFYWGGEYKRSKDAMHFEYKLPYINIPKFYFPQSTKEISETPILNLKKNEAGNGGFYPIGLMQNLHTGIHLPVEGNNKEIRSVTDGYIVAARLMAEGQAGDNPVLQKFIGKRHLGFVCIRHELEKKEDSGKTERFPIYSLYMHLSPPDWENANDPYRKNVSWFKKIMDMSIGGVVDLDPVSGTMGKNLWATEKIESGSTSYTVAGGKSLNAETDGRKTALAKPAPEDVTQAVTAFKNGFMVTFNSPVLPVQAGEVIGYAKPRAGAKSTSLHWELFSPSGKESGLEKLLAIDTDLASLFQKIAEEREDNFFELPKPDGSGNNELEPLLVDKLPPDDQSFMRNVISKVNYSEKLKNFFNKAQSFSRESLDDAGTAEIFTYPVSIVIKNPYSYSGPSANTPIDVAVSFKNNGSPTGKKGTLKITDYNSMIFNIQVPADADTLCLESENCLFDSIPLSKLDPPPATKSYLEPIISCRWRNIRISHITEWRTEGLNALLDMLKTNNYLESYLSICNEKKNEFISSGLVADGDDDVTMLKKLLLPIAWWGRKVEPELEIYGGEHAVCGSKESEKSLFDSILPSDGKIDSMHPVSATWLLQVLEREGKISIKSTFPSASFTREEDAGKLFWKGWVAGETLLVPGDIVNAVAVQHGYGSGTAVKFMVLRKGSTEPLTLGETDTAEGVAVISREIGMWGTLTLKVKDASDKDIPSDDSTDPKLEVAIPEVLENGLTIRPPTVKSGHVGVVAFIKNIPKGLQGFLYLRYWTAPDGAEPDYSKTGKTTTATLPVICGSSSDKLETIGGVKYKNNFVVGGNGQIQGVTKFGYSEFKNVYQGEKSKFTVYLPLCQKLQEIRGRNDQPKIKIDSIADGGRSIIIHPVAVSDYTAVITSAKAMHETGVFEVSEEGNNSLKLTMPEQTGGGGTLSFSFDSSGLLDALITEANPAQGVRVFARPSFIAPNGGHDLLEEPHEDPVRISTLSPDRIKKLSNNDFLETHSDFTFPALGKTGFGKVFFTMSEQLLYIHIPLEGDISLWKKAQPEVKVTDNHATSSRWTITGNIMSTSWTILSKGKWYRKGTITFDVLIKNPDALSSVPHFTPVTYDATPKLLSLAAPLIAGESVIIRGEANCMFTDIDLKLTCQKNVDNQWQEDAAVTSKIEYVGREGKKFGRCDAHGKFEATLPLPVIEDDYPRRFVWERTYSEGNVHGIPVTKQISTEFVRPFKVAAESSAETSKD